ncbi:MAG: VOC family protein [Cyanothece sp. SIO1E1]|nr:VOC family protein [Cyanothece sp. SIO1E1]
MSTPKHFISWFEIPVSDIQRAKTFYESIFQVTLTDMDLGDNFKMAVFPGDMESISGALIYNPEWYRSSNTHGPLVYLNGNPDLQTIQDRIETAGGTVTIPKRQISPDHGYMAVFEDTEGNRVALHSQN